TAIFAKSGGSVGIGFAIPSNIVRVVVDAEANGGKLVRPWIGASGEAVTAEIATSLGLTKPGGVVVRQVYPNGPAARAGIKPGDVIVSVNNKPVNDAEALRFRLATQRTGKQATLQVLSRGTTRDAMIALIAPPDTPAAAEQLLRGRQPLAGALVANLSPALSDQLSVSAWSGVVVTKLQRGSFADQFGLQRGD